MVEGYAVTTPAGTAAGATGPSGGAAGTISAAPDPQSPTQAVYLAEVSPAQKLTDGSSSDVYHSAPTG
jgi:hypothetical protein